MTQASNVKRRDFIHVASGAMAGTGVIFATWPFIDSFNPAADVRALAKVELDLSPIEVGERVTIRWRGNPIFVVRRTAAEIASARADDNSVLPDQELDSDRAMRAQWLIVIGICTHLGCVPLGQRTSDEKGLWGGWFCPCHGSHYDVSGRIRKGPAPRNLDIPPYTFLSNSLLHIG